MANKVQTIGAVALEIKEDTPGMWNDYICDLRPIGSYAVWKDDFLSWDADNYTVTEATAATQLLSDTANGILVLTAGAGENQGCQLTLGGSADGETVGESFAPAAGKNVYFETRVAVNDVLQNDIFVGLHNEDTTIIAGRGTDYIGFYTVDESASLNVQTANTSVVSTGAAVHTLVNNTYVKLGFKVSGTDKVEYYVNDALVETLSTNIPTALMKLSLASLTGEATANTLSIDYVVIAVSR
jgi:hypothetical protein